MEITSLLEQYPEIIYGLSVCFTTWIVLYYFIPKPSKQTKFAILVSTGLLLGIIFYLLTDVLRWPMMILAFLASTGFYELIIKVIMRKFKMSYEDK